MTLGEERGRVEGSLSYDCVCGRRGVAREGTRNGARGCGRGSGWGWAGKRRGRGARRVGGFGY